MEIAVKVLTEKLHSSVKFTDPQGGYFVWLAFPESFNSVAFNQKLQNDYKVCAIPGNRFSQEGLHANCLRICVVFHEPAVIEKGIKQLCLAINDWFAQSPADL